MKLVIDREKNVIAANPESYPHVQMQIMMAFVGMPIWDVITNKNSAVCLSEIIYDVILSHYKLWNIVRILHCGIFNAFDLT